MAETNELELTIEEAVDHYIKSMTPPEKVALEIAKEQLQTSFDIEKSLGFKKHMKNNNIVLVEYVTDSDDDE